MTQSVRCTTCKVNVSKEQACNGDEKMLAVCKLFQGNGASLFHGPLPAGEKSEGVVTPFRIVRTTPNNSVAVMRTAFAQQKGKHFS